MAQENLDQVQKMIKEQVKERQTRDDNIRKLTAQLETQRDELQSTIVVEKQTVLELRQVIKTHLSSI
jgi:hypothetical protein